MRKNRYIVRILIAALLLMAGGAVQRVWATNVTYHILTLPIDNEIYHMKSEFDGKRVEAVKVTQKEQSTLELPAAYKSPLATGFTYYAAADVTKSASAVNQFDATNNPNKAYYYTIKGDATPVAEGSAVSGSTAEYYVVYTYNASNPIAKLDGSVRYNIKTIGYSGSNPVEKGFMALNRGRNNRPAVIPEGKINPDMYSSEDFVKVDVSGTSVSPYWSSSSDNKNPSTLTGSKFFFMFKFVGEDPYNIIIKTAYDKDTTYIEKNDNTTPAEFVYKYYKGGSIFSNGTANCYIASDEHIHYNYTYNSGIPNPTVLTEGTGNGYDARTGYYHGQTGAMWNSFALLNNSKSTGYVFMGTRTVNNNGVIPDSPNYLKEKDSGNNLVITSGESTNNLTIQGLYPIKKLTFKVATPFYAVEASDAHIISVDEWVADYIVSTTPIESRYLPAALKRKYIRYTGKFYRDAACTQQITYFSEAVEHPTEGYQVYVGYELTPDAPKFLAPSASYTTATWYELTDEGSTQEYGRKIKYDGSSAYKNNGANGEYVKESEFALVGDPYELKVLSRKETATAGANRYVSLSGYTSWDMPDDDTDGSFLLRKYNDTGYWNWDAGHPSGTVAYQSALAYSADKDAQTITFTVSGLNGSKYYRITTGGTDAAQIVSVSPSAGFVYRETETTATIAVALASNTSGASKTMTVTVQEYDDDEGTSASGTASVITITQGTAPSEFAGNTVEYSTTNSTRVRLLDLPKYSYTYHIVDLSGRIAVKASALQPIFSPLSIAGIPSIIVSPYILDETVAFYDDEYVDGSGRSSLARSITETPNAADNIFVTYTTTNMGDKPITLSDDDDEVQEFNVVLNGQYLYYDDGIKTALSPDPNDLKSNAYLWQLRNADPYAMKINNNAGGWVKLAAALGNDVALAFDAADENAQLFVAKASVQSGVYEVMVATGAGIDAATTYYNIGRTGDNIVRVYDKAHYAHGSDYLKFHLEQSTPYTYHLIDKSNHELLTLTSQNPDLALPAEYQSPLVGRYHFYSRDDINIDGDTYTVKPNATELSTLSDLEDEDHHIYVTYDKNDLVTFGTSSPYMLRFLEPDSYYLEDGNDGLTSTMIEAIYPYCNGDGNLNIYGDDMQKEQMGGGASTRPRWVWYFTSATNDPYHVRIHSRSTISYNGVSHPTYLQTYAVHFNQDANARKQTVVTGGTLPGVASEIPTEYMVLGTPGAFKLMTTQPVVADLDGDGTTTGAGENERHRVTSLEQYWKTYNMAKLNVLGISASTDAYSDDASTWVVPAAHRATLEARGWHSYTAYANAVRWNGYNDKTDGHKAKVVEQIEHWYQTFDMGNGTFDIESADIPPVLVLLDMHGWEIMRLPLPTANYPEGDAELEALRAYDSPLVKEYKFYSNATKASGCHKYSLRMQNGAERDQIKVNGVHYTSTSLGDLPPVTATGVKSSGMFNDQYVTYTVKEEYVESYQYTYDEDTQAETETPSTFIIVHNGRFYKTPNSTNSSYFSKPVYEHTPSGTGNVYDMILDPRNYKDVNIVDGSGNWRGNCLWYIKPNQNIDKDMGIKYAEVAGKTGEPWTEHETKKYYYDNGKAGFDPYNLQIQLLKKDNGTDDLRYLTSHQTSTRLVNGVMVGGYDGVGGTTKMTLEAGKDYTEWDPEADTGNEGYDHTNLTISNQTFMAVSDAHGNMQLMPRFDHTKRVNQAKDNPWESSLEDPRDHTGKASAEDNSSMGAQTVFFVRPLRLEYHIIDNFGRESIRYKRAGDDYPAVTDHFRSPLAKDFTYYTGLAVSETPVASDVGAWATAGEFQRSVTRADQLGDLVKLLPKSGTYQYRIGTRGVFAFKSVRVTKGLLEQQIESSLAAETDLAGHVYVRYDYDADADHDADRVLEGKWFTVQLANKDLLSSETRIVTPEGSSQGTGVDLYAGESKPSTIDEDDKRWQWKFLVAPTDPSSDYFVLPDPYAVQLFNRYANYTTNPTVEPSPMAVGIKVPDDDGGIDRFALLSHTSGGYALAAAGTESYNYYFLNGASMTTSVAADTVHEVSFTQKTGIFDGTGSQILLNNDVEHNFVYRVINKSDKLAVTATQTHGEAAGHDFFPYLPEAAQTPLLNMEDYTYYGFANHVAATGADTVIPQTVLYTLYGLYDDIAWVKYRDYHVDSTSFKIPNKKTTVDGKVARDPASVDVSLNINGELPYNIVWENNNMMASTDDATVTAVADQALSGSKEFVWYITGNDPYALKLKHKGGKYINGDASLDVEGNAKEFMLLRKSGYDYGILQETGSTDRLSGYGHTMVSGDPTKFIIFGLSVHQLIYRLVIAHTCTEEEKASPAAGQYVDIPYRAVESGEAQTKRIYGTTQRNLDEAYQLGTTLTWGGSSHTYCHDAGEVSIGDDLAVPNIFNRPNCTFDFYIAGIYDGATGTELTDLENKYKGLKLNKLMSDDALIDETVVVNIVYSFNQDLATNNGLDFVKSINDKCWYTFETGVSTPYLAQYTNANGLLTMQGRETRYTNDYLWTPVGDVYGFKLYNRYMIRNSNGAGKMLTFAGSAAEGKSLVVAEPGTGTYTSGNEIFELLPGDVDGYFRVHPVINYTGTQYYIWRDETDNEAKLSATPSDWTFGLSMSLLEPYYQRAGYPGGLTAAGKTAYDAAVATGKVINIQSVVYDDANIIPFAPGYYRLHSQPGVSGISPVRYASGYLHDIERTAVSGGIPMHFYSREGRNTTFAGEDGLGSGFTETAATRGDIPIPATEYDPSTIFYLPGNVTANPTISTTTMHTQGLNVSGNQMTTATGTTFNLIDIGGAVFLIVDTLDPATRQYLNFDQRSSIYDLKFMHDSPTDDAKWCLQPVQQTAVAGDGEMPLMIATNNGGDGYYYATFYAPYDVLLPADGGGETYHAYTCRKWYNEGVNPVPVPATGVYAEGKLIPAATPVIIRTTDESESLQLTLPSTTPSSSLSCAFTGSYLEQLLAVDATRDVYTLGLPLVSEVEKAGDYVTSGDITAPLPEFANTGVGFYINATRNKEADVMEAMWRRNNRYVLHNKIYYRAAPDPSPAPGRKDNVSFVPVLFGDGDEQPSADSRTTAGDGGIYDLLGRRVATKTELQDDTWQQRLEPGIYIVEGSKIYIH